MHILIVDDDPDVAKLLAFGLRLYGYIVEVAENGREALSVVAERSFGAILLDWNMPVMGGEEFLEQHRARASSAPVAPVVVITARHEAEQKARELGAVAVVPKPFDLKELVRVLERVSDSAD